MASKRQQAEIRGARAFSDPMWDRARNPPAPGALNERDRRALLRPRSLTAAICGDPLPGYSALDRRGRPA